MDFPWTDSGRTVADARKRARGRCCRRCSDEVGPIEFGLPLASLEMILCPTCGNKRCPAASDHRLGCTGSNEPGQPGSVFRAVS